MPNTMTETATSDRDQRSGRFLPGNSGFGGRPRGSRNKLGEAFLEDLRDAWNEHGATALTACAINEPGTFCKIVSSLLPRTVDINIAVDPQGFVEKFRTAVALLGNDLPPRQVRRPLPGQRVIENVDVDKV
jgi:hypothetical protein